MVLAAGQGAWYRGEAGTDYLQRRHRGVGQRAMMVGAGRGAGVEILLWICT